MQADEKTLQSALAIVIRELRAGTADLEALIAEIRRQLSGAQAAPAALLAELQALHTAEPLPADAYAEICGMIEHWPREPAIVTYAVEAPTRMAPRAPAVGDELRRRFKLRALIGESGMSRVFKATDLRQSEAGVPDPYVAVKVFTDPLPEHSDPLAPLQREVRKLQVLAHPNIAHLHDCDRDGQAVFVTMEFLAGESLQAKLRRGADAAISPVKAQSIVVSVADALDCAHRHHIVHGDLKPGSVFITDRGEVKVMDFGIAGIIARLGEIEDLDAVTPRYASPQRLAGDDPQPADDIYALACLAYEVLSGRHPFAEREDSMRRDPHVRPPRPPRMRQQHYSALVHALAFDPRERTPTARQFLDEFTRPTRPSRLPLYLACGAAIVLAVFGAAYRMHTWQISAGAALKAAAPLRKFRDCPSCPLLSVVPAGWYEQGGASNDTEASDFEWPRHRVVIAGSFAIGTNETTVGEFREFAAATGRDLKGCNVYDGRWQGRSDASWQNPGFAQSANHPVTCVSWNDAEAYAAWLSRKSGHVYRLPSAAEWEYAALAGGAVPAANASATACAAGNVADRSAAQRYPGWQVFSCTDGYVNTAPVGSFRANAFGLHDMLGNVFEWTEDCWNDNYVGAPADGSARRSGNCREHEMRGGSWYSAPRYVRASYRNRFASDYRSSTVGFRVVREMAPP